MRNESSFVSYSNYQARFQEFSSGLKVSVCLSSYDFLLRTKFALTLSKKLTMFQWIHMVRLVDP